MATNITFSGVGSGSINFGRKINVLHISVQNSSIGVSLDGGVNFVVLPVGFHTLHIGIVTKLSINGSGNWQIVADHEVEW